MKIVFLFLSILMVASCAKDSFIDSPDASLATSNDSIFFDTLFTSTGSITKSLKIYNTNNQRLRIDQISLAGGTNSYFHINADGTTGPVVNGLELDANDSIYVFVTVNIDPESGDLPFVIEDSIQISYNGNSRVIKLSAWGQNAHFLQSRVIISDTTWSSERPIVITGGLLVAQNATLTIEKGTRIYLHADAPLLVDGRLVAIGERHDSTKIIFRGDRLDEFYRDFPGSWPGIYFTETSAGNFLKHVEIKNAYQGLVVEKPSSASDPKLKMEECIVDNCYDAGILGVNSSITAINCLISNCGKNILLVQGGDYSFTHCTNVAVSNAYISHREPAVVLTDFLKVGDLVTVSDMKARFVNCIIWGVNGTVEDEVAVVREGSGTFNVNMENCLVKATDFPADISSIANILNEDPLFGLIEPSRNRYDFRLLEGSPAINSGGGAGVFIDLDGNGRTNIPDIGAYETTF